MNPNRFAAASAAAFTLLVVLNAAPARSQQGPGCLSRPAVQEILRQIELGPGAVFTSAEDLLRAETYVESERFSSSQVRILQRNKRVTAGMPVDMPEYAKVVTIPGSESCPDLNVPVPMSQQEVRRLEMGEAAAAQMADFLEAYSDGLQLLGASLDGTRHGEVPDPETFAQEASGQWACAWAERISAQHGYADTLAVGSSRPGATPSAYVFLLGPACFAHKGAEVLRGYRAPDDEADAARQAADISAAASTVEDRGSETIDGVPQRQIAMSGLNLRQAMEDGRTATVDEIAVWIDERNLVRTRMRMEGVMEGNGERQPFFMETIASDFRAVPGTALIEPYREVLRMGGMLTPAQQAQLRESEAKLAELDRQLAAMPAGQRAMMERMMGSQIEQMRSLARGGAVEFEVITTSIVVNPDLSAPSPTTIAFDGESRLIRMIQEHLTTLGYDPGNSNGELTRATVVAITRFEAAQGIEVTGRPTPQLAGMLAAAVDAQRGNP